MEHDGRADELGREADDLEERSERLGQEVADVRDDWEAKKDDGSLPGAQQPDQEPSEATEESGDEEADGPEA